MWRAWNWAERVVVCIEAPHAKAWCAGWLGGVHAPDDYQEKK
jgi:hypothetical protein